MTTDPFFCKPPVIENVKVIDKPDKCISFLFYEHNIYDIQSNQALRGEYYAHYIK